MGTGEFAERTRTDRRWLQGALVALVLVVLLKYVVLLADEDWNVARSPLGPLVLVTLLAGLLAWGLQRKPWVVAVAVVLLVLFAVVVLSALLRDGFARESWADYPFAYGGLIASAVGVFAGVRLLASAASRR